MGLTAGTLTWMSLVTLRSPPLRIGAESLERLATEPDFREDMELPAARGASRPSAAAAAAAFLLRMTMKATTERATRKGEKSDVCNQISAGGGSCKSMLSHR